MVMLTDLADVLRRGGVTVKEHPGWKGRGYAGWQLVEVRGTLWHHTATNRARFAGDPAPTLEMCVNGRPGLAGPLCHIVLGRDGVAHVIAAGWANHAGRGFTPGIPVDAGNAYLVGIEMESSGLAPWDWTAAQLAVIPAIRDALRAGYGHRRDVSHAEYSSEGKIDPAGLPGGMGWLRSARATTTAAAAAAGIEEDNVPYTDWPKEDRDQLIRDIWGYEHPDKKISGNRDAYGHLRRGSNSAADVLAWLKKTLTAANVRTWVWRAPLVSRADTSKGKTYGADSYLTVDNANIHKLVRWVPELISLVSGVAQNVDASADELRRQLKTGVEGLSFKLVASELPEAEAGKGTGNE